MAGPLGRTIALTTAVFGIAGLGHAATIADAGPIEVQLKQAASITMVNPAAALRHAEDIRRRLAASPAPPLLRASADRIAAEALLNLDKPAGALPYADAGLAIVRAHQPVGSLHSGLLLARGGAMASTGHVQQALADYQRAYRMAAASHYARGQIIALQNIGTIYRNAGDYRSALRYNRDAIAIMGNDPRLAVTAYNNSGNALVELGRTREAEVEYRHALDAAATLGSPLLSTRILQNLARAQAASGNLDAADATLRRAFAIARSGPAASWRPALDGVAALVALRRDRLDEAEVLIRRAVAAAPAAPAAIPMRDFHRTAYEIYRRMGRTPQALAQLEAFKRLDDEARALTASNSAALMSARFDFTNQHLKIARLGRGQAERDKMIEATRARLHATIFIGVVVAAAIVSAVSLVGFVSVRRSRNQVRAANATLSSTNARLEKALAIKTEFLATTSHEIRTPLNGILGMTQVMLADKALTGSLRDRIGLVHGAGETMKALVDDILDMAKIETGEMVIAPTPMDLRRLLTDAGQVWAGQAETKGLALTLELDAAPGHIVADETRLRQIVFNLMANAIKFTERGGIRLSARAVAADGGERLVIAIADTGIGIPASQREAVFDSFRQIDGSLTRRHGGTGLGLAICRNLARAMGGDVMLASEVGLGSTFTVDLPLLRATAPAAPPVDRAAATGLTDVRLLVIDANPLAQGIIRAVLGGAVAGLSFAADADTARSALTAGEVDHVLADGVTLGLDVERVRGLAAAAAAAGARLTLLWPAPTAAVEAELRATGIDRLLGKPIAPTDILAALQTTYGPTPADRGIAA